MHAALGNVAEVPREQLEEHVKDWDKQVREHSHRTEVVVDTFQVRILGSEGSTDPDSFNKRLTNKMENSFRRAKARHEIAYSIKRIKDQIQDLANENGWYRDWCEVEAEPKPDPDPRLKALITESANLVGIHEKREELIKLLVDGDEVSKTKLKTVSIVGLGGLGKTTLAKAVYDKIKGDFDCTAFVSVGQKPDAKKGIQLHPVELLLRAQSDGKFGLGDHVYSSLQARLGSVDADWHSIDQSVVNWLYMTMSKDIFGLVVKPRATARKIWVDIEGLFRNNRLSRAIYLEAKYHNLHQGQLTVSRYCGKLKTLADALRDVSKPVSEPSQVLNMMLVSTLPVLTREQLPPFVEACSHLLLLEQTDDHQAKQDASTTLIAA
ncbi:disease resistance protein RGA5-like [Panicum virgatum]|uniref:disease resistance protein RGA5-like n=1 Tax=Panicum virgatum TaxID=38727 RepID=UPI0019D5586F|nr:disease resistance protein RGA5-like [Panicum virgatum]